MSDELVHGEPLWGRLRVVCASANPDKVAEIAAILGEAVELLPRPADVPDVIEDADTLVGNARLKAVALVEATGLPSVADDTGLELRRRRGDLRRQPPEVADRAGRCTR